MSEDVNLEQIRELVKLVEKHKLSELTVEEEGLVVTIKGASAPVPATQVTTTPVPVEHAEPAPVEHEEEAPEEPEEDLDLVRIEAPMVGVFYRSPSPDAPPFIEVGETIEVGQTIGMIEAMKVFSEIPAEIAGVVVDIPVANSKLVQQGDPLVVVRKSQEG